MKKNKTHINNALLGVITPIWIEFKRVHLYIGESINKVYGVVEYHQKPNFGWLSKLMNIKSTVATVIVEPINSTEFIEHISSSIIRNRSDAMTQRDPLRQQRAERAAIDGDKIIQSIDGDNEAVCSVNVCVMPIGHDKKELDGISRKMLSVMAASKCKVRPLTSLQKQGFIHMVPYHKPYQEINDMLNRVMDLKTFVGGFPFATSGYSDKKGYYFAKDKSGELVVLDPWQRGDDRTNSNFTILGVAGVGKSTVVKHLAISEYMKGTKIIFIDPEGEYRELCNALKGDLINAGGGADGRINPLQIRDIPAIQEKDELDGLGPMALHLKNLEVFFNLYMDLTEIEKALLKSSIIELYNSRGIGWESDIRHIKNDEFPVMKDLYELIAEKAKEESDYKVLAILLKDIAIGGDAFLFGRHSSITTQSKCICLDTLSLQNASENVKKAQYFNLLTWCWDIMSQNRNEKVLLIADEAYLMIDPKVPQSLVFLRDVAKRARKYEAGLAIVSHSVVDFLAPSIKLYGQALLDIPCYKILMGTDGKNLTEIKQLYQLTDAEEGILSQKKRGRALMMIGSKRLYVNFDIPKYKFKYMGTAGGR